jgi:hypothetical protein
MSRYTCISNEYTASYYRTINFLYVEGENSTFLDSTLKADNYSGVICAEGYYLSNDSLCRPLCSLWVDPPGGISLGKVATIVSAVIALFSSIIAILLALTLQRSTM